MALSKNERENVAAAGGTAVVGSALGWGSAPLWTGALVGTKAGALIATVAGGPVGIVIGAGLLCVAGISALRDKEKK